jgi:hypothetical protein
MYIEDLKGKVATRKTYTIEPSTIATTLGCFRVTCRCACYPFEQRHPLPWCALILLLSLWSSSLSLAFAFSFDLNLAFAFSLALVFAPSTQVCLPPWLSVH